MTDGIDAGCRPNDISSRVCEEGTKGCDVRHGSDGVGRRDPVSPEDAARRRLRAVLRMLRAGTPAGPFAGNLTISDLETLLAEPTGAAIRSAPVTAAEAFELGYVWRGMLQGQTMEDSRAVGRTLQGPMFDALGLDLSGWNSFETADHGVVEAKARIRDALTRSAIPGAWEAPYRSIDASGSDDAAGVVGWRWIEEIAACEATVDPGALQIETPTHAKGDLLAILYRGPRPIALAFVYRDPINWSVLMRWRAPALTAGTEPGDA